jgi:uncharacterized iron-regulated membrane protein
MIDRARDARPGGHVARVVLPLGERGAFLVMFAGRSPTPAGATLDAVYLDRFTGERVTADAGATTAGTTLVNWMAPLHVGSFGGAPIRVIWFAGGLMPTVLCVTGLAMWWRRRRAARGAA